MSSDQLLSEKKDQYHGSKSILKPRSLIIQTNSAIKSKPLINPLKKNKMLELNKHQIHFNRQ